MFAVDILPKLRQIINDRAQSDSILLDNLRREVNTFSSDIRKIQPRTTTAVSLVASDGGNNRLAFDPFYVQLVRVTDSYGKELCLDIVSPTTDTDAMSQAQFGPDGSPRTALGRMMVGLDVDPPLLSELSHFIPSGDEMREDPESIRPEWVQVYRDLCEWAVLYERICFTTFATDTLIVRDGLLRTKDFARDYFIRWRKDIEDAIDRVYREDKRRIYLVGIAKHSKVLTRYQLAMAIENIFPAGDAYYVHVPREIEAKAYLWPQYARGPETEGGSHEAPKFVAGDMYLVRFGNRSGDPIWAIDLLSYQSKYASEICGYLLNDAIQGFPVPFYPLCLQKAHQHAQIVDFDLDIFQDEVLNAVRNLIPKDKQYLVDAWRLKTDVSQWRYR